MNTLLSNLMLKTVESQNDRTAKVGNSCKQIVTEFGEGLRSKSYYC